MNNLAEFYPSQISYTRLDTESKSGAPPSHLSYGSQKFLQSIHKIALFWILASLLSFAIVTSVLSRSIKYNLGIVADSTTEERPLILYAYHESDNARQNILFFIHHGLHDGADFVFIINGESDIRLHIPHGDHIKVIERANKCYDIGAYGEVLMANDRELAKKYKKYIMLNASIRGPFLPLWSTDCWSEAYLRRVTEQNKLVGLSFNCKPSRHVQSMILATDNTGLDILLDGVISNCFPDMASAVEAEMNITSAVLDRGYSVNAMMTAFASDPHYVDNCTHDDLLYDAAYFGTNMHPYEAMFQKANRNINPEQLRLLTEWHDIAGYSSQPFCGKNKI